MRWTGVAAVVLIGLAAAAEMQSAAVRWATDDVAVIATVVQISLVVHVAAGLTFVVWMSQARARSELITSGGGHRFPAVWVFGGWLIPFGNLFIPQMVMQDIWRGSDRSRPAVELEKRPKSRLVTAWWLCFVASAATSVLPDAEAPLWTTISAALGVAAAVLAGLMIGKVTGMLLSEPTASPAPAA
ncbi:DUF4328 domain-containing protein [Lentzea flava]|uniref:DUF4328 domain-containing protein n=1 Tax=Lentzea flava TaxID=103732 RepID=A0ABQ2VDK4_9PSEU|nr:DUF4328 domain-containing protein [Lentzea flava]MCP2204490.1 protein of unknown function (DUF4328) [Lentzea flava]GGU78467.1 hypothetical protein GCM10010178_81890 [Lentzea flava]